MSSGKRSFFFVFFLERELGSPMQTMGVGQGVPENFLDGQGERERRANVCSNEDQCDEDCHQLGDFAQAVVEEAADRLL